MDTEQDKSFGSSGYAGRGLVHLYWGEGKGKTTAAMGLALRMLGSGGRVVVVQFLKNGASSELGPLIRLGASVYGGQSGTKFAFQMTEQEKKEMFILQTENLRAALQETCDLLVLDEACAAWQLDVVDRNILRQAVEDRPRSTEIVLTGREPAPWMLEAADYSTKMCSICHPYEKGVQARKGVEF